MESHMTVSMPRMNSHLLSSERISWALLMSECWLVRQLPA